MSGLANKQNNRSVTQFIEKIDNTSKREDSFKLLEIIENITQTKPKMWGNEANPDFMIGFGKYTYTRKGGKEEFEWFKLGFAPRKTKLTLYLTCDISQHQDLLDNLGKCKWGKGCLYINKLNDVNIDVLSELIKRNKDAKWH